MDFPAPDACSRLRDVLHLILVLRLRPVRLHHGLEIRQRLHERGGSKFDGEAVLDVH